MTKWADIVKFLAVSIVLPGLIIWALLYTGKILIEDEIEWDTRPDVFSDESHSTSANGGQKNDGIHLTEFAEKDEKASVNTALSEEDYAKQLIREAFAFSIPEGIDPELDINECQSTIQYTIEPGDIYLIELKENFQFPSMIYHFNHLGQDKELDIADDSSYHFNNELTTIAQNYVSTLYGLDCSNAEIHAYGYKDKVAVQLKVKTDQIFHVRYYYNENTPTGILFHNDITAFERFLDENHAKQYL